MGSFWLTVQACFSAAHWLPGYEGECSRLHGHTWRVEVTWIFDEEQCDEQTGLCYDFRALKEQLHRALPDHCCLNERFDFPPTAENLARYFAQILHADRVRVWEGEDACATYVAGGGDF